MKKALMIIVLILVLGGAVALVLGSRDDKTEDNTTNTAPSTTETTQPTEEDDNTTVIIYSDTGFIPGTLTVAAGTTLTVTNNSSEVLQFASDSHPSHTDNPELNLDSLDPGESLTFTPTVKGTHGVHNHEDETKTMTLIVE